MFNKKPARGLGGFFMGGYMACTFFGLIDCFVNRVLD
jgi:hypothetical protein